ncbi:hypothetical protein Ancab_009063 [Ancistrocladus abbreviatus]
MDDRKLKGELQNSEEEDLTEKGDQKQQSPQEASLMLMNREIYRAPSLKLQKLIKAKDRIPEDVIFNKILVRLPVKTILRFKSASKLWCSTISSQEFAKAHLKRSISDPSTKSVISNIDACGLFKLNYASYDNLDEENDDEVSAHGGGERLVQLDITFLQRFHLAGSCHGLVALLNLSYTSLYIWNPSIKLSSKILFPSEVEDLTCTDQWLNFYYGFGYVSSIDDYEFFVGDLRGINFKYTQVTDKWSEIDSKYIPGIESLEASNFRGLLVGETLHWIMYDSEVENLFNAVCILGLSLVNETLQEIPLPSFALNNGAEDLHVELYDLGGCLAAAVKVAYDARALKFNGERKLILSGAIQYPRSTPEMWPDLMRKAKEGGLNAIETYVFWNLHEPLYRQYNFSGNLDFIRFFKTIQSEGLYAILRIGPYVCAEWNYGGFPMWLHNMPNIKLRTNNDVYKAEMQIFVNLIVRMAKKANLFASQGGPIILAQLNTCNGFYCDQFKPNREGVPKMWTKNWTGWFKAWGQPDPQRTVEDLAFSVARFFQKGGSLFNYYMYHGGTNFGRTSGGPYMVTSYDYDAILDEYGNKNQPKWGHLKQLHKALFSMAKLLLHGEVKTVTFTSQTEDTRDANVTFNRKAYKIPAWSVSILPDCNDEVYNTTKVNTQTSLMARRAANLVGEEPETLH